MAETTTPNVVVVGAGIVGASIAFHAALRGAHVIVVDAGEPGAGASAVSFAWINARDKKPRHYHDLNRRSLDMWERFARRLGKDVGLRWGGEARWATTAEGRARLVKSVAIQQAWGYPVRLVDPAWLEEMEPGLNLDQATGATYTDIEGHVDTRLVIDACLDGVRGMGGVIRPHTEVTDFRLQRDGRANARVDAVSAGGTWLPCDVVVVACGADTQAVGALGGVRVPVSHSFGATILTEPALPVFRRVAIIHTPREVEPQLNIRQLANGAVMIHGGAHGGAHDGSLGRSDLEIEHVYKAAVDYLPALSDLSIAEVRRGRRPLPKDGLPIVGYSPQCQNLYVAAMHSGVSLAALVGEMAAIEIVDHQAIDLLQPYRPDRFEA